MNKTLPVLIGFLCLFIIKMPFAFGANGDSLLSIGKSFEESGDFVQAKKRYQKAEKSIKSIPNVVFLSLGRIHNQLTEYDSAKFYLKAILNQKSKTNDSFYSEAAIQFAIAAIESDEYDSAYSFLQLAKENLPVNNQSLQGELEIVYGYFFTKKQNFSEALATLEKAIKILNSTAENSFLISKARFYLGYFYQVKRNNQKALENYDFADSIMSQNHLEEHPFRARIINMAGQCYRALGDAEKAKTFHQRAFNIQRNKLPDEHLEFARTYQYLGICAYSLGDNGQAIDYYQLALKVRRSKLGNRHRSVASLYNNIGLVYWKEKITEEALTAFSRSLDIFEEIVGKNSLGIASRLNNMGLCYGDLNNHEKALEYYERALSIRKKHQGINHFSLVSIYNNMGLSYRELKQFDRSIHYHQMALKIMSEKGNPYHPRAARHCNNIARAYRGKGNAKKALEWHQEALKRIDPSFSPQSDCENPPLEKLRLAPEVLDIFEQKAISLKTFSQKISSQEEQLCLLQTYELVSAFIDSMRVSYLAEDSKFKLAETSARIYEGAIEVCWELFQKTSENQYLELAFDFSEKQKSVILLESVRSGNLKKFGGLSEELLEKESRIKYAMAEARENTFYEEQKGDAADSVLLVKYSDQFFKAWLEYDSLLVILNKLHPDYVNLKYRFQTPKLAKIQSVIGENSSDLIEYFLGKEDIYIFYFTQNQTSWIRQKVGEDFSQKIEDFRKGISAPFLMASEGESMVNMMGDSYIQLGKELYDVLISPLQKSNQALSKHLIIIPDGTLGYLPFDALLTEKPNKKGYYRSYPYLLKKHSISFQFSAALLGWQNENTRSKGIISEAIAFAPAFGGLEEEGARSSRLSPLPYGKKEVQQIGELFGLTEFEGDQASLNSFFTNAQHADLIHISSHAKVNDQNPKLSAIYFSGGDSLLILDLFNLNLKAKLVTLSACETGIGKLRQGEGIMSLARGFAYAGAESIINSLWQVNDEATAQIMTQFYRELISGKAKDESLRQAKLNYIKESDHLAAHPFYWAGQIAIGDMEELEFESWNGTYWLVGLALLIFLMGIFWKRRGRMMVDGGNR